MHFSCGLFVLPSRPATSFLWITSPWRTLKFIIWKHYKFHIIGAIILVVFILLLVVFIYTLPVSKTPCGLYTMILYILCMYEIHNQSSVCVRILCTIFSIEYDWAVDAWRTIAFCYVEEIRWTQIMHVMNR